MQLVNLSACLIACGTSFSAGVMVATPEERSQTGVSIPGDPQKDPKIGTFAGSLLRTHTASGAKPSFLRTFVVYAGECAGCVTTSLRPSRLPMKDFGEVAIVFKGTKNDVKKQTREFPNVILIADELGDIGRLLNPRWLPRWYVITNGTVSKVQESPHDGQWSKN